MTFYNSETRVINTSSVLLTKYRKQYIRVYGQTGDDKCDYEPNTWLAIYKDNSDAEYAYKCSDTDLHHTHTTP